MPVAVSTKRIVAAVHAAPVFMNTEATIDKVVALIGEAADQNVELLVFPETFVPGYPYWINLYPLIEQMGADALYAKAAIEVPGPEIQRVQIAAAKAGTSVVLGICERLRGTHTLFNSQVFIDNDGTLLGVHRKLQPTFGERTIWGQGGGATLNVYDSNLGRIGGLICWEHTMSPARQSLATQGEQIHAASWPGLASLGNAAWEGDDNAAPESLVDMQIDVMVRAHAVSTQSFVISAGNSVDETCLEWLETNLGPQKSLALGGGQSLIVSPFSSYVAGPYKGVEDKLLVAEIDLADIDLLKVSVDSGGHYSRPEVFQLHVDRKPLWHDEGTPVFPISAPARETNEKPAPNYERADNTV
ncbi:carbon-nitrogen hydrolase family protein [Rhodococcus sp. NPDC059968]|uniref:carbon-nitrogen hydrolase family protein n=1 Tax=Rhodococcus sp. NPDC059968 TaxID=3347017 RepID=UPI003671E149